LTRRAAVVLLIAALGAVGARVAAPSRATTHFRYSAAAVCGIERWTVKTLQDRPRLLRARATTVAHLVSLPAPHPLPTTRLPFEYHIFSVIAAVTLVRPELDKDLHLVLRRGSNHMIAEAPSSLCTTGATSYRRRQMSNARNAARLCSSTRRRWSANATPVPAWTL
jgi:hypothetical protein